MCRCAPLLAVAAVLLLTGCGAAQSSSSGPPTYHPSTSPSPGRSTTTSPAEAKLPTATPAAPSTQHRTTASAEDFARYAFRTVELAYARRDMKPVLALVADRAGCSKCASDQEVTARQRSKGYYQVPAHLPRPKKVYPMGRRGRTTTVGISFDMPPGSVIDDRTGAVRDRLTAAPGSYFEAILRWQGGRWRLQNYSVQYGGKK